MRPDLLCEPQISAREPRYHPLEGHCHDLPARGAPSPLPREGIVLDASGKVAGGLLVFLRDGLLLSLEVYSHGDPLPMPDPGRIR